MQHATYLLPGHYFRYRHGALEDEARPMCREVLLRKLGFCELLDVGREVMRQNWIFSTSRIIKRWKIHGTDNHIPGVQRGWRTPNLLVDIDRDRRTPIAVQQLLHMPARLYTTASDHNHTAQMTIRTRVEHRAANTLPPYLHRDGTRYAPPRLRRHEWSVWRWRYTFVLSQAHELEPQRRLGRAQPVR